MEPCKESAKDKIAAKGRKDGHKRETGGEKYTVIRHYVGNKPLIELTKELTENITGRQTEIK